MKKYSEQEIKEMGEKADIAITTMTVAGVGIGFAPVMIDVAALMVAMGTGVVAVGHCYKMSLTKEDAGELIKQFFKSAGLTFSMVAAGQKITASVLKSNPVTYLPTMIADAVMCGSIAFAVGYTSKRYFREIVEGKTVTSKEISSWMKEGKKEGKKSAKIYAEKKKEEFQKK